MRALSRRGAPAGSSAPRVPLAACEEQTVGQEGSSWETRQKAARVDRTAVGGGGRFWIDCDYGVDRIY